MPAMLRQALATYVKDERIRPVMLDENRVFSVSSEQAPQENTPYAIVEVDREVVHYEMPSLRLTDERMVYWRLIVYGPEEQVVDDILEEITRNMSGTFIRITDEMSIRGAVRTELAVSQIDVNHQLGWQGAAAVDQSSPDCDAG